MKYCYTLVAAVVAIGCGKEDPHEYTTAENHTKLQFRLYRNGKLVDSSEIRVRQKGKDEKQSYSDPNKVSILKTADGSFRAEVLTPDGWQTADLEEISFTGEDYTFDERMRKHYRPFKRLSLHISYSRNDWATILIDNRKGNAGTLKIGEMSFQINADAHQTLKVPVPLSEKASRVVWNRQQMGKLDLWKKRKLKTNEVAKYIGPDRKTTHWRTPKPNLVSHYLIDPTGERKYLLKSAAYHTENVRHNYDGESISYKNNTLHKLAWNPTHVFRPLPSAISVGPGFSGTIFRVSLGDVTNK